jgi:hypothetical protein
MKKSLFIFISCWLYSIANAQTNKETLAIVKEGKMLYRSEMASWYGTDIFVEKYANKENIGGYFSYPDNETYKCIFFSKGEQPKVIGTMAFDSTYNVKTANVDLTERDFSKEETNFYTIRNLTLNRINSDTTFKRYNNTELNIIPVIDNNVKKAYVLTSPKLSGTVILGNDYLIDFTKENEIAGIKKLHKNLIPISFTKTDSVLISVHSHLPETGDYITATDICTLMLYSKFTNWTQHYVLSAKNVSIWDIRKNALITLTREAWDRIVKDQQERHKKIN